MYLVPIPSSQNFKEIRAGRVQSKVGGVPLNFSKLNITHDLRYKTCESVDLADLSCIRPCYHFLKKYMSIWKSSQNSFFLIKKKTCFGSKKSSAAKTGVAVVLPPSLLIDLLKFFFSKRLIAFYLLNIKKSRLQYSKITEQNILSKIIMHSLIRRPFKIYN